MKNNIKWFGFIALVAVIMTLAFAACGNGSTDDLNKVVKPVATPAGGTYTAAQSVSLSTTTTGADIYYTLSGSEPTAASAPYTAAIPINSSCTLKAIAIKDGMTDSDILTAIYTINIPGAKTVEAEYWFSGGDWYDNDTASMIPGAVSKLDENSFSVEGGGVDIFYTGVYTEGDGIIYSNPWAYVYAGSVKIGLVIDYGSYDIELYIGKTCCNGYASWFASGGEILDLIDMQDIINGEACSPSP